MTVVRALLDRLPGEDIVYFGDTARVPYGSKSEASIIRFAEENTRFLMSRGVKLIVVACNTATATALPVLQEKCPIPVLGVVEPGARQALSVTRTGKIGVIGTMRTIASGAYETALRRLATADTIEIVSAPCPLFVPLIEENWLEHQVADLVVKEYLQPLVDQGIDTLVLGCTHYPLLAPVVNHCYPHLCLVDSAVSTALEVEQVLVQRAWAVQEKSGSGGVHIFLSDYSRAFRELAERILERSLEDELGIVDLEEIGLGA